MSKVGKNIKKIRGVKGLSQQKFAELFNLSRGNISSYEEFRAEPRIETIVSIAKYFSIPLNDFILKDLSVNELIHFDSSLVIDPEKLKIQNKFVEIPYVSSNSLNEYISNYQNLDYIDYIKDLPCINIPSNSKFNLIAFEVENSENLPLEFSCKNGDIIVFESIEKENIHRIINKLGLIQNSEGIKPGIFRKEKEKIFLTLNDFIKYPFDLNSKSKYWVARSYYSDNLYIV